MKLKQNSKAQRMYDIISLAPMGEKTKSKSKFRAFRDKNDAKGMKDYFDACLKRHPDIGESIEHEGKQPSFEQLKPEVDRIYFGD